MKGDPTFWILARAAGFTAYVLVTTSVLAGLVLKSRPFGRSLKPSTVTDVHRFLALMALSATAVHGVMLLLDSVVEISISALFVPGLVPYRPLWTGIGVCTAELMLIVYVSFSLRRWIGVRSWRRLHWTTYLLFAAATVHGIAAGTDSGRTWAASIYLAAIGAVTMAASWRFLVRPTSRRAAAQRAPEKGFA